MLQTFQGVVNIFIACAFLFVLVVNARNQRNYFIEFTKCNCAHNFSEVKAFECSLRNDSNQQFLIDVRVELASPIEEFSVRAILNIFRKNMPRMTLIDMTVDACSFMDSVHKHKLFSIFRNVLQRYMNVVPRCPLKKDFNYTVTGLQYDVNDFPSYFPEGEFKTTLLFLKHNQIGVKAEFWGRVVYFKGTKREENLIEQKY